MPTLFRSSRLPYRVLPVAMLMAFASVTYSAETSLTNGNYLLTLTPNSEQFREQAQDIEIVVEAKNGEVTMKSGKESQGDMEFKVKLLRGGVSFAMTAPFARIDFTGKPAKNGEFRGSYVITGTRKDRPVPEAIRKGKFRLRKFDPKNPPLDYTTRSDDRDKQLSRLTVISSFRTIATEAEIFRSRKGAYPKTLAEVGSGECLTNSLKRLEELYTFTYKRTSKQTWTIRATPKRKGFTHFFMDTSGVIRQNKNGPASVKSPALD